MSEKRKLLSHIKLSFMRDSSEEIVAFRGERGSYNIPKGANPLRDVEPPSATSR